MQQSKIFIADDSPIQLILLEKVLEREGFSVQTFGDGSFLLEAVTRERPDLVISDIDMPILGGFDVVQEIKGISKGREIPCCLISSKINETIQRKVNDIGADGFIKKPLEHQSLISGVNRLLKKNVVRT
ncbi:MAG: response regulator [Bacteroidota bacterium]